VQACLQIVWKCRVDGHLKFWALENPVGLLRQFIGVPRFTFEQWQYGGDIPKPTDVWGFFNPPRPTTRERPELLMYKSPCGSSNSRGLSTPRVAPEHREYILGLPKESRRAAARAITPEGFARAFFRANR